MANKPQIKNIYNEISNLTNLVLVMENASSTLDDLILIKPQMVKALESLSTSLDTLDRTWEKKEVIEDIDAKVADLVERYNIAKAKIKYTHSAVDYSATDKYWVNFDKKSSNEVEVVNNPATQKFYHDKRIQKVVKGAVTITLIATLLGGAFFHGIRDGLDSNKLDAANAQIGQLQDQNAELQARITKLLLKIAELEDKLANASGADVAKLQAEIDSLKTQLADALADNALLQDENVLLRTQIKQLQDDLKASNTLVEQLKKQLAANPGDAELKRQLAEALAENQVLKDQNAALLIENDSLRGQLTTLNNNYNILKKENDRLDEANSTLVSENEDLKDQITELNDEITELEAEIERLNAEVARLADALSAANAEITRLQAIIDKGDLSAAERAQYEAQIKALKESNANLESQLQAKTAEYNTLLENYGAVVAEKDELLAENAELKEQITSYEQLETLINEIYVNVMSNNGSGLSATEKLQAIITYYKQSSPTDAELEKLYYVYAYLYNIDNSKSYESLTPAEFNAFLEKLFGSAVVAPSDRPSDKVNEGGQGGNNNSGSQPGANEPGNGDTAGRLPGDN